MTTQTTPKTKLTHVTLTGKIETRTTRHAYTHVVEGHSRDGSQSVVFSWSGSAVNAQKLANDYSRRGHTGITVRPITPA